MTNQFVKKKDNSERSLVYYYSVCTTFLQVSMPMKQFTSKDFQNVLSKVMNIIWVTLWRTITVVYYHFINNLLCNKNEKKIVFTILKLNTKQMYKSYWQKMKSKQNHIFIFIFKNEGWRVLIWTLNFDFFWNTMYMHVILYFKYINIFHIFLIKCLQVLRHFFFILLSNKLTSYVYSVL